MNLEPGGAYRRLYSIIRFADTKCTRVYTSALLLFDQLLPFDITATLTFAHARSPLKKQKEISLALLINDDSVGSARRILYKNSPVRLSLCPADSLLKV